MRKIFKYPIPIEDNIEIIMPEGATILKIGSQMGKALLKIEELVMWVLVDPSAPKMIRKFRLTGTGHPITESSKSLIYVDSVQMRQTPLVFHLFEII